MDGPYFMKTSHTENAVPLALLVVLFVRKCKKDSTIELGNTGTFILIRRLFNLIINCIRLMQSIFLNWFIYVCEIEKSDKC